MLAAGLAVLCGLTALTPRLAAQGCINARFMALSLGPDGITQLQPGQWEVGVSLRYLYADEGWRGTNPWPEYATIVGNQITMVSTDLQATYAFDSRYSATLTVPYIYGQTSNWAEHGGAGTPRHTVNAHGIGDIRLVGTAWLFDPATHQRGNLSLGFGFKVPTGDEDATGLFHKPTGLEVRPVDMSIQSGDGGWGIMLEAAGFWKFSGRIYGYANGYYQLNPSETNDAYTSQAFYGQVWPNSVPDQYLVRAGLTFTQWPVQSMSASLGLRVNGVPAEDLIGGSAGFRRCGYAVYVEPGLTWSRNAYSFNLFVPVRLDANRTRNVIEQGLNTDGGGAFARYLVVTSVSRKF
jgi:hypothetical protein